MTSRKHYVLAKKHQYVWRWPTKPSMCHKNSSMQWWQEKWHLGHRVCFVLCLCWFWPPQALTGITETLTHTLTIVPYKHICQKRMSVYTLHPIIHWHPFEVYSDLTLTLGSEINQYSDHCRYAQNKCFTFKCCNPSIQKHSSGLKVLLNSNLTTFWSLTWAFIFQMFCYLAQTYVIIAAVWVDLNNGSSF